MSESISAASRLQAFKKEEKRKHLDSEEKHRQWKIEFEKTKSEKQEKLLPSLRKAQTREYTAWVDGYIKKGNVPTSSYNYKTPTFYVAMKSFKMIPLYGAQLINIIIPENVSFLGGDLGHCNLYFMKEFKNQGGSVPVYEDTLL